jgi:hypothetical protein
MKRSGRSEARPRSRGSRPTAGRAGRGGQARGLRRLIGWSLVAVALIAGAVVMLRARRPAAPAPALPPWPDADAAYVEGVELARHGRYLASLPALRYAAEHRFDMWQLPADYATALLNAVHEGRVRHGLQEFAVRSSYERVAMVAEALRYLDLAERRATQPRDLAEVRRIRAQFMKVWGFPWNAFVLYREAQYADTSWRESAALADLMMDLIRDPTRPDK